MSFSFKLIHGLLPSEQKISSILRNSSPVCRFNCRDNLEADFSHIFFFCESSKEVGEWLFDCVTFYHPEASPFGILTLSEDFADELVWIILQTLNFIWSNRIKNKRSTLDECLSTMEDTRLILERTQNLDIAICIQHILNI